MHRLDARQHNARAPKRFEAEHRSDHPLDEPMILLDEVAQILGLAQLNRYAHGGNEAGDRCRFCAAHIDRDLVG